MILKKETKCVASKLGEYGGVYLTRNQRSICLSSDAVKIVLPRTRVLIDITDDTLTLVPTDDEDGFKVSSSPAYQISWSKAANSLLPIPRHKRFYGREGDHGELIFKIENDELKGDANNG